FACAGHLTGVLGQAMALVSLLAAYFLSIPAGRALTGLLVTRMGFGPSVGYLLGRALAGTLIYMSLACFAHAVNRRYGLDEQGEMKPWNRRWGAALGAVKGLALAFLALCVLDAFQAAVETAAPRAYYAYQRSLSRHVVSRTNPLAELSVVEDVKAIRAVASNPEAVARLQSRLNVAELLAHPKVKALAEDETLAEAIRSGNYPQVLTNGKVRALMEDEEVIALAQRLDVMKSIREVAVELKLNHK
ncbi:MAG: CvpA family protein, partial [Planctomycetes bacterium]|nr:CvpA family protein [Planctomycetota bacterium]